MPERSLNEIKQFLRLHSSKKYPVDLTVRLDGPMINDIVDQLMEMVDRETPMMVVLKTRSGNGWSESYFTCGRCGSMELTPKRCECGQVLMYPADDPDIV